MAGGLAIFALAGAGSPAPQADRRVAAGSDADTSYAAPNVRCRLTDPKLGAISGLAATAGRLYLITDNGVVTVSTLDPSCRLARIGTLTGPGLPVPKPSPTGFGRGPEQPTRTGMADVAVGTDGSLWFADVGGAGRPAISLYRWTGTGTAARFVLRYPDGPRTAETMLLSYSGDVVIVTKAVDGRSAIYLATLPLEPETVLVRAAELDVRTIRAPADTTPASLQVTGGAVAPDGTHFTLRTGTTLYEWDTPDGDLVRALRAGAPRAVPLRTVSGGGVTYAEDGRRLLAVGSAVPADLREVALTRAPAGSDGGGTGSSRLPVLGGAFVVLLIGAGIVLLGRERRRAAITVTTYQSGG